MMRNGRRGRDRTYDPRFWRPVLYQLSYAPIYEPWCKELFATELDSFMTTRASARGSTELRA